VKAKPLTLSIRSPLPRGDLPAASTPGAWWPAPHPASPCSIRPRCYLRGFIPPRGSSRVRLGQTAGFPWIPIPAQRVAARVWRLIPGLLHSRDQIYFQRDRVGASVRLTLAIHKPAGNAKPGPCPPMPKCLTPLIPPPPTAVVVSVVGLHKPLRLAAPAWRSGFSACRPGGNLRADRSRVAPAKQARSHLAGVSSPSEARCGCLAGRPRGPLSGWLTLTSSFLPSTQRPQVLSENLRYVAGPAAGAQPSSWRSGAAPCSERLGRSPSPIVPGHHSPVAEGRSLPCLRPDSTRPSCCCSMIPPLGVGIRFAPRLPGRALTTLAEDGGHDP